MIKSSYFKAYKAIRGDQASIYLQNLQKKLTLNYYFKIIKSIISCIMNECLLTETSTSFILMGKFIIKKF